MVILDTNIIIDHLRQKKKDTLFRKIAGQYHPQTLAISIFTIQELYQGKSSAADQQEKDFLSIINALKILPYTFEVAELAGKIARDRFSPIEFADSAIAATAIINGCQLFTLDKKDFIGIDNLELLPLTFSKS